jgi:hypothetical protein
MFVRTAACQLHFYACNFIIIEVKLGFRTGLPGVNGSKSILKREETVWAR